MIPDTNSLFLHAQYSTTTVMYRRGVVANASPKYMRNDVFLIFLNTDLSFAKIQDELIARMMINIVLMME